MKMLSEKKKKKSKRGIRKSGVLWPRHYRIFILVLLIFFATAILHIKSKLALVELGYRLSKATSEHKQLLAEQHKLQVEVATLKNPRRLRKLAVERFGLVEPDPTRIVQVQSQNESKMAMGQGKNR